MESEVYGPDKTVEHAAPADFGALMAITKSEIDMQIATAKKYPRDLTSFVRSATSMATMSEKVAGECFYRLERKEKGGGKKIIEGPSVRMAEIVVSAWGNCRAASRIIEEGDRFIVSEGAFVDLERNTAIKCEVRRRITDRNGNRYGDDMILTTANAACSIAMRNAVTKGIPRALWEDIYNQAVRVYKGDAQTLPQRRGAMVDYFKKLGVTEEQIWVKCSKRSLEVIDLDDLVTLRGIATAIKDGDCTIEQAFADESTEDASPMNDKLDKSKVAPKEEKKQEPEPPRVIPSDPPTDTMEARRAEGQAAYSRNQQFSELSAEPQTSNEDADVAAWIEELQTLTEIGKVNAAVTQIPATATKEAQAKMRAACKARGEAIRAGRGDKQ